MVKLTLENLEERAGKCNILYALGVFKEKVLPPFLVATTPQTSNYYADNKVYFKSSVIYLELVTKEIEPELEQKIENEILFDVCWEKQDSSYISDEKIWNTAYFFEI